MQVWNLKTCKTCLEDTNNKSMIFLKHMIPVLEHVRSRNLIPIMWDDMMREWTIDFLKGVYGSVLPLTKNARIKEIDFRQILKALSLQYGCHIIYTASCNHVQGRSQDFSRGGSHCVKVRVLTRLSIWLRYLLGILATRCRLFG